jgi:Mrp family chromosome partitioning ATPase
MAPAARPYVAVVTACGHGAGTSTVAVGITRALAEGSPLRLLLVDANLRRPSLHRMLGVASAPGFTDALDAPAEFERCVRPTSMPRLWVMAAGTAVDYAPAVCTAERLSRLLDAVGGLFDFVVLDGPPLLAYPEVARLASVAHGSFLVVAAGDTKWQIAERAKQKLEAAGSFGGIVLNKREDAIPQALHRRF